jgi:hypothetical protein
VFGTAALLCAALAVPVIAQSKKGECAMTTSMIPPNAVETSKGTRLAPALDRKLAGPEPLLDVAAWYATQYNTVLSGDERLEDSSDLETAAMAVHLAEDDADFCVWRFRRQGDVCGCFAMLKAARAAYAGASDRPV